ncbi:PAS domain-containing hybrid sensor histidine kinase/response regulator [Arenibaculum pallidiluteum]|uniref:PAS domain-containing hybrid sensor histidine kinase/response regulator n=1 Tax=Arenibaculum pallidiluteum TaxID=2812559 RepID=UPI001A95ACD7|nr:ATP-binding protein [Arenibaculum pallidiluteum]
MSLPTRLVLLMARSAATLAGVLRKPLAAAVHANRRWRSVSRPLRTGMRQTGLEPAAIRHAFDDMAETLEARDRQRRAAEEAAADSERRYRFMADTVPQIVWTAGPDGTLDFIGARLAEYLGAEDIRPYLDKGWTDILHPDDLPGTLALWTEALRTGEDFEAEYRLRRHDGQHRWHLARAVAMRDGSGGVVKWFGSTADIHDRRLQEDALRAARDEAERATALAHRQLQELEGIYAAAPIGLWLGDRNCRFLRVNTVMAEINGLPIEAQIGRTVAETVPGVYEFIKPYYDRVLETGQPVTFEVTGTTEKQPGAMREWVVSYHPLTDETGVYAVSSVVWEVTEERRTKRALAAAKDEAERANMSKSKFLAAASHDLRQPLQSMFLFAETLRGHVRGDAARNQLTLLERGLDTLKLMLDSLLDISRLDARTVTPHLEAVPLASLVQYVGASYEPVAATKGLALKIGDCCDVNVRSDPNLLGRMLRNLIENAIRYTGEGEVRIECRISGDRVRVEVRDTGIGIPPEHRDRIFEEFHQVGNSERDRSHGLGLGLAIVRRLSKLLDHPVQVVSEPGLGSVFSIEMPVDRSAAVRAPPPERPEPRSGENRTAVIVDDDPMVLLGLQGLLQNWGYEVLVAGSVEESIECLRHAADVPDIIVADYRLRDGHVGTEAVEAIRAALGVPVPAIILTGETTVECQREVAALGLGVAHKPVTPRQLGMAIEKQMKTGAVQATRFGDGQAASA